MSMNNQEYTLELKAPDGTILEYFPIFDGINVGNGWDLNDPDQRVEMMIDFADALSHYVHYHKGD